MKSICVMPFMHALILPNGSVNLCCNGQVHSNLPHVNDLHYGNILNNSNHIEIRKQLLAGEKPTACNRCWDNERMGVKSLRQQQNINYLHYLPRVMATNKLGELSAGVKFLDVRFNNTCNLSCVMCSSDYSSSWRNEEQKLVNVVNTPELKEQFLHRVNNYDLNLFKWENDNDIVSAIINNVHNLDRLHFAGGEPLLSKQHNFLIKELIRLGVAPKLYLSYNTNGEFIDDTLLRLWSHFKHVKVFYSLDDIRDRNEYIRYPSLWKDHDSRLDWIDRETPRNIDWKLLSTVSLLNIAYIPELADWKLSKKYKNIHNSLIDGNLFHACLLENPRYLNSNVLPIYKKEEIKKKLLSFSKSRSYRKISNECVNFMFGSDQSALLLQTKDYLTGLDTVRGTDFRKVFPILADVF